MTIIACGAAALLGFACGDGGETSSAGAGGSNVGGASPVDAAAVCAESCGRFAACDPDFVEADCVAVCTMCAPMNCTAGDVASWQQCNDTFPPVCTDPFLSNDNEWVRCVIDIDEDNCTVLMGDDCQ
jgi:hypothetical protein